MINSSIDTIKKPYKKGTRVELINMDDIQAPKKGTRGTIEGVDDMGDIMVNWDNGSSLKLIVGLDDFKVITESKKLKEEETKESTPEETKTEETNTQSNTSDVADNTTTETSGDTTSNQNTETGNQADATANDNNTESPKEEKTTPDATTVAMSKVFNASSDLATTLAKLTEPISKVYIQDGKVFVENESSDNRLIEQLGVNLPAYLKLSEAKALFQTKQTSLNNFLDDEVANYLNDRGINITSISRDQTGKFTLSDGANSYRIEDIKKYINNTQSMSFDTVNPLTNEDLTKIKTMLVDKVNKMQKKTQDIVDSKNVWILSSKKKAKIIYRVGNIIKSLNTIKIGESLIKKFKENDADILNTALSNYYTKKSDKTKTDQQVQIQFFAYLYGDKKATDPLSNQYANKQDVLDIAKEFMNTLNNEKMTLEYTVKDNDKMKSVSQLLFYMGDENNILIPQGKNYVAFTLVCTKDDKGEKNKKNVAQRALGVVGNVFNTLATASGAVINADKASAASSSAPKAL